VRPPILEFDPTRDAVVDPIAPPVKVPDRAVLTWFSEVIDGFEVEPVHTIVLESARQRILVVEHEGQDLVVAEMGVGAPLSAAVLETVIAMGCTKFVAVGSSGGLVTGATPGTVVVPVEAIRDEGTSYHYLPPEKAAKPSDAVVASIIGVLRSRSVVHSRARTWTTDAFFRETAAKIRQRTAQGCVCVDMEASALFAVAEFRGVDLGQILYVADTLIGGEWDPEGLVTPLASVRRRLFDLAAEAVLAIPQDPRSR
jgi:uridine phosphorylase